MSEQNLATILDGIEELYRMYRRHGRFSNSSFHVTHGGHMHVDVTSTLTKLIINDMTNHSSLLDSFVVLHAAFVSSLYRLIGVEFGMSQHFSSTTARLTSVKLLSSYSA